MLCEDCAKQYEWLVVTEGVEWIGRFCSDHLRKSKPSSMVYMRKD